MPISPGTRLGPYEIDSPIGAGGMGEVYRARDTRLNRTVAVKILSSELSSNVKFQERFAREARAISSLNHAHICTLHDIGHQEGLDYLVMEYLEGETLASRLKRGALPLDQALRYAIEIADALDQAHLHGVVHRDLKPGNIMLTKSGAKLLDFGLSKLRESEVVPEGRQEPGVAGSHSPTLPTEATSLTEPGMMVGTFQYMAPEQLEGKDVDARTDIFAFGVVLYEMVAGRRAFDAKSRPGLIAAILEHDPPPISTLVPTVPPLLNRILKTCLAKDPEARWQSAHDLRDELQWTTSAELEARKAIPARPGREGVAWGVAILGVLIALMVLMLYVRTGRPDVRTVRFVVLPPDATTLSGSISVSPDGKQLAFVTTTREGNTSLWVRPFDSLRGRVLPGTDGADHPFWSPDSRFLGFFAESKLKKIRLEGGPPQTLCDVFDARGGTWNRDGVIVFSPNVGDRLYRIADSGGKPAPVTTLNPGRQESSHQWPYFLPDGRHFLYLNWSEKAEARGTYLGSLDSPETTQLLGESSRAVYATGPGKTGYVLFVRGDALLGQAFDTKAMRLAGEPFPVGEEVWYDATTPGLTAISVSENGVLAYRTGGVRSTQLSWFDRTGKSLGSVGPPAAYHDPWLSPDEKRIVVARIDPQTGTDDVWVSEMGRGVFSRFTFHPGEDKFPVWSPDGARIVFASNRDGAPNLYQKASSGAGNEQILLQSGVSKYPTDWSRDGRFIVYANWDPVTRWDLWVLPTFGDRKPIPYLQTEFDSFQATFSPDLHWIAYTSNETGRYEVYVQPFPTSGAKWHVSTSGGAQPRWRRDGRELFYLAPDRKLMAVELKPGPTFQPGVPTPLFQTQITGLVDARNHYCNSGDGQRFLINAVSQEAASPVAVALNWAANLK